MGREKDVVWQYWKKCDVDGKGKQYATCRYCEVKLQVNVCRFKQHLVVVCPKAPINVKSRFKDDVLKQSCATAKQKLQLPLALSVSDDSDAGASISLATCTPSNSQVDANNRTQKRSLVTADTLAEHETTVQPTSSKLQKVDNAFASSLCQVVTILFFRFVNAFVYTLLVV